MMDTHINIESDKELKTAERLSVSNEGKIIQPSPHTHTRARRHAHAVQSAGIHHRALRAAPPVKRDCA